MLAVRGDMMALLAHHLVELRAPVAAHELEARAGVTPRERAQELEEPRVEIVRLAGGPIGEQGREALGRRRPVVEGQALVGVRLDEGAEEGQILRDDAAFPVREAARMR